jgi:[acyl-carrier-protein] S-malonyltransferase
MQSAQERLDLALGRAPFADAGALVVANVDATEHRSSRDFRGLLSSQLCRPVRWRESVQRLVELGVDKVVELGPGAVLTGMVKRIAPDVARVSVASPDDVPS